ncbi:MAG TPA: hypothetical protein VIH75_01110 [Candidatus Sulfotelmatobacter sp.]|jgi:hypothetical protein
MKALTLALLFSLPVAPWAPQKPVREPSTQLTQRSNNGRWYFAASGHAVYCYGPVMTLPRANGDLQRVATLCRDGSAVVPLKD